MLFYTNNMASVEVEACCFVTKIFKTLSKRYFPFSRFFLTCLPYRPKYSTHYMAS